MNVTLPRWTGKIIADKVPPLVWTRDNHDEVLICCGNGHLAGLNHEISTTGKVTPSILCRTPLPDGTECGWHVFATIEGYP